MVEIDAVLLCAHAEWMDGNHNLINLIGVGANAVQADGPFPWALKANCGLVISADGTDFGTATTVTAEIVEEDGNSLGVFTINWDITRPINYVPGLRFRQSFPTDLSGFIIPSKGIYSLNVSVDGQVKRETPFLVY
ncbi:MAG: hypothetical protein JO359_00215 [Candidatus Eremiobacteraeota bacterium]|nr:hypothetical protein [Candidatus Eremiobacteraeota bacterium]